MYVNRVHLSGFETRSLCFNAFKFSETSKSFCSNFNSLLFSDTKLTVRSTEVDEGTEDSGPWGLKVQDSSFRQVMGFLLSCPRRTGRWSSAQTAAVHAEVTSRLLHGHFLTSAQRVIFFFFRGFSQFILGYTNLEVELKAGKLLLFFTFYCNRKIYRNV